MISASTAVQDILKGDGTVETSAGAILEYNLNSMVENIKATSNGTDHALSNAFKKLFPIDTIYKPFRPVSPGIKYYIYTNEVSPGVQTDTPPNSYSPFTKIELGTPRLYYPGPDTVYKYWVGPKNTNIDIKLEYFTTSEYTTAKLIPTNKIIARFETNHDTPTSWTITGTKSDGTTVSGSGTTLNSNGEAIIYYNGTSWSTTEPSTYNGTQDLKQIKLTAVNSNTGKFIGVLELSPRWVIDISNDIQSFDISKQTSLDQNSILPVGTLTANTLNVNLVRYDQSNLTLKEYSQSDLIDNTKVYLFKNTIIKPYINIKDGETDNKINQGTFYIHSWDLYEFGTSSLIALDAAKILQESLCPLLLVEDAPVTSSIKRLLDSIGFSNYQFYLKKDQSGNLTDTSIPTIKYFWTSEDKTVWETIQELCRDIQMNASVDENNILNFYSRDYIYDTSRSVNWNFTSEEKTIDSKTVLPNIVSLTKKENSSANSVKVLWQAPANSMYDGSSSPLWTSDESYLGAGSLSQTLSSSDTTYFSLTNNTIDQKSIMSAFFGFNGYALVNGEIIEYDGIEYQYVPKTSSTNKAISVLIKSQSDIWKYKNLSKPGYYDLNDPLTAYFKPTGRYKIKTRGALGTTAKTHTVKSTDISRYTIGLRSTLDSEYKGDSSSYYKAPTGWTESSVSKSFLSMTNLDKDKTTFSVGVKEIPSISTSAQYFAFGTRMFFDDNFKESSEQVGGLSVFTGNLGTTGYYIVVSTTGLAKMGKDIRILKKRSDGKVYALKDSQTNSVNTFAGIYAAETYNIDVLIKTTSVKNIITVFINGFKIQAEDNQTESNDVTWPPVSPTKNVGLLCGQGIAYFDYIYGVNLESGTPPPLDGRPTYASLIAKSSYSYNGVYSDDTVSMLYGDIIYKQGETVESRNGSLIEFGTTAREIRNTKTKYDVDGPSVPIRVSTGGNKYATVLDKKMQPFNSEMYVLNNTSTFIPLHDNEYSTYSIIGNEITKSGQIEYSTDTATDAASKEQVIFQSNWIQSESDAKSLADWIKTTTLNKNRSVNLEIFGNPLISPGDIITINYPFQGLSTDDGKYIVVDVQLGYSEGVNTTITCRAI